MARRVNRSPTARQAPTTPEVASADSAFANRFSFAILLASICALAFFLRFMHVLQTFEVPTLVQLLGDAKGYFDWAVKISEGDWYGTETFYQAPLYPYFLAVVIKIFGPSITLIRLVQMMLGVAGVALIGLAGRKLFSERVGLVSALMLAAYPPAIYYDGIIQKAALATFLLCVLITACASLQSEQRWWYAFLAGVSLGLLVLTRENALLWTPLIPLWILLGIRDTNWRRWTLVGCYASGLAVILLPVAARNASLGGAWSPTTFQAGPNFYIGNNLQANGIYVPLVPGHGTPMYERADAERLAEQAVGHELSAREVSQFWMSRAWEEIRQSPSRWLQLMLAKTFMVFNRYEVPDVESMYVYRDYSWPLKLLGPLWHFGILCPLAVWGIVVTRDQWRRLWLYYLLILVMVAAVVLFFILGRYRQPLVPLLILFAAIGLCDLWRMIRDKDWSGIRAPLAAASVFVIACNIKVHDESMLNASSYMNQGIAAAQVGDLGTSIKIFARTVQMHPEMAEAHLNLGRALGLSNRVPESITCYENALQLEPELVMAEALLAEAYERVGDPQSALRHYQRAIQIDPSDDQSRQAIERLTSSN